MASLAPLIVPAIKKHTATVIFAHGLGDTLPLAQNWRRRGIFEEVAFVFPNAPSIPISVNFGMSMPGWYDIASFDDIAQKMDEPGILRSQSYFHSLIQSEIDKGISSHRIILGGFSQGGAMSLFAGVTSPHKLGGIVGLSSYLLLQGKIRDMVPEDNPNKETKIFMGHGDADTVVKVEWGRATAGTLRAWGWDVDFREYPGLPHSADPEEIDHVEAYIKARLPPLEN
ncbi:MAG: hypothetical protein M1819_004127 [Sarea resinae]|nr:MAG: hypothetical protein M1819_004127 [Sarea resinae]